MRLYAFVDNTEETSPRLSLKVLLNEVDFPPEEVDDIAALMVGEDRSIGDDRHGYFAVRRVV